jgi:hypothetical protein
MLLAARRVSYSLFRRTSPSSAVVRLAHKQSHYGKHWRSEDMTTTVIKDAHPFDKARLEGVLTRRFFYAPAFEIYQGA